MYSPDAFRDPKLQGMIDEKIQEYAPFIFSNKNQRELMNYLDNAQKLLKQKKKDFGVTDQLESVKINPELLKMTDDKLNALAKEGEALQAKKDLTYQETKRLKYINNLLRDAQKLPETGKGLAEDLRAAGVKLEADVFDIKTGKKAEGIETLKEDLGLPPEVSPKSKMGKNLQELKRVTKEADIARKDMDKTVDTGLEDIFRTFMQQPSVDTIMEGKRRAVIRKILLKDDRINLPKDVRNSLENYDDLRGGGTKEMDPLTIFDTYYKRDRNKFETLDSIIDTAKNEVDAAGEFKFLEDGFDLVDDPKPPKPPRDEKAGGGLSYLMGV